MLKGQLDRDGYYKVEIRENKKRKWYYIHRLVAMQYIPNPENKPEVNQYDINGNFIKQWKSIKEAKKELHLENAHISQVCQEQRKTAGGFIWKYDTDKSKLNREQVLEIRENKENLNRVALAQKYGVSCSCIQHIRRGRTWKDVVPGGFGDKL